MCRLVNTGYFLLNVAVIACALSFSAPFWLYYSDNALIKFGEAGSSFLNLFSSNTAFGPTRTEGLLAKCNKDMKCQWFWQNDFEWENNLRDWQKACQGLFAAGLLLLLIGWFISTFHVCCCRCCKESFSISSALGSLTLSGLVLIAAALCVYGAYSHKDFKAGFEDTAAIYYWAFFVGIGGAVAALVAAILFFCEGCRNRSHVGYHMTRVV